MKGMHLYRENVKRNESLERQDSVMTIVLIGYLGLKGNLKQTKKHPNVLLYVDVCIRCGAMKKDQYRWQTDPEYDVGRYFG